MDGLTPAEISEYWETVEAIVADRSIQWMGQGPEVVEEVPEAPEPAPKRTRDTDLAIGSPSKRNRDKYLPQRKGTL